MAVRPDPPDDAGFTSSVNTCPSFAFHLLLPRVIRAGEAATASVWAVDTDSDDTLLRYAWSATAGDFSEPASSFTEYACAGEGPQLLSVVASDPEGCESALDLDVTCEAP